MSWLKPRPTKIREFSLADCSGLQFFRFFDERKQPLGTDPQIHSGFGVLGALGVLHAALEVRNFRFGKRESCRELAEIAGTFAFFHRHGEESASPTSAAQILPSLIASAHAR